MKNNISHIELLVDVVHTLRSPDGCPWDKKQSHQSLRRYLLEEAYEVVDAIDEGNMDHLKEELGDLLLQVIFHSQLAAEKGQFTLQDVIDGVTEKMIHRHPTVFPVVDEEHSNFDNVSTSGLDNNTENNDENNGTKTLEKKEKVFTWDELKAKEKGNERKNVLDGIGIGLPALLKAQKLSEKAAKVGFYWDSLPPIWAKVDEEMAEFKEAIEENNKENMENEAGDVLFSLINLFIWYKISGENALNRTNTKFHRRFAFVEARVNQSGRPWNSFSLSELDAFWDEAKVLESHIQSE